MTFSNFLLVTLLVLVSVSSSLGSSCRLTISRTSRGAEVKCSCPGVHTTIVPMVASVDVGISCLRKCLISDATRSACKSGSSSVFNQAVRDARPPCCSRCGGRFQNNRCNRIFLESRPLQQPVKGCVSKVRETVQGQAYACRCATGLNVEVPFFIATGVDDECMRECGAIQDFGRVCKIGEKESDIRETFRFWFELCCAKGCVAKSLDGTFACGIQLPI